MIFYLITLPAGLMLGLQIGTVEKQYERAKENFADDVKKAVQEAQQVYALWNSHTSSSEDARSYNSLYSNPDSTFVVMIAQSAQPYPLLDFQPDTLLPKIRKAQFLQFQQELEATRRKENRRLREFYVLRSIQYCADCAESDLSIAQIFPMDSLIREKLKVQEITTEARIAFYHTGQKRYVYTGENVDTLRAAASAYQYPFTANENLQLYFPRQKRALRDSLFGTFISSLGLVLISLLCYGLAARMLYRQKKLSEMKNDFINNVTHEFKTPIATITFALANIENEKILKDPVAVKQFTQVIKEESRRLNRQVEKVLESAMLDKQVLELKREKVNLHQLIQELVNAYELKIRENGRITLHLDAPECKITGDAFHLSNAISNLLDNAIKYSEGEVDIDIQTKIENQNLILSVADRGMGISKEQQKLIFEKFYRVPTGNLHNIKGFGLGLSYVKAIVEAHAGEVSVRSQPQKGSIFIISLPLEV